MSFTLGHGFAVSLLLHGALLLPFVIVLDERPPDDEPPLVVELQGLVSDTQSKAQAQQQTGGAPALAKQDEAREEQQTRQAQAAAPDRPEEAAPEGTAAATPPPAPEQEAQAAPPQQSATPTEARSGTPGLANVAGAEAQKQAQRLAEPDEAEILRAYIKGLSKRLRDNLIYPPDAQRIIQSRGTTLVSFTVEADGRVRSGSLKIEHSSGRPPYDAAALRTVEASAPFDPPPGPMSIVVPIDYFPN